MGENTHKNATLRKVGLHSQVLGVSFRQSKTDARYFPSIHIEAERGPGLEGREEEELREEGEER